jgi:uncharacterized membrane protein YeaQ/YmgE (transglycosylase-associated protein family)
MVMMSHAPLGICSWLILGGLAGWIAKQLAGAGLRMGLFAHILTGIVGAVIGGMIFHALGGAGVTGLNLYSLFVAVVGAACLLTLVKAIVK